MNRIQKREAMRRARRTPMALYCAVCDCKTLHIAKKANDIDHYDVYCEICGNRLLRAREGQYGVTGEGYIDGRRVRRSKKEE